MLGPGAIYDLHVVTYEIATTAAGSIALEYCTLGMPPMSPAVVVFGVTIPTTTETGIIQIPDGTYVRGDCNDDGGIDLADPIFTASYLFQAGLTPSCFDACDANDDGLTDIADVVYTPSYLFGGGSPPPSPFPDCGVDIPGSGGDDLGCELFSTCP